jgi:hypothetical protein
MNDFTYNVNKNYKCDFTFINVISKVIISKDRISRVIISKGSISRVIISKDSISRVIISKDSISRVIISKDIISKVIIRKVIMSKVITGKVFVSIVIVSILVKKVKVADSDKLTSLLNQDIYYRFKSFVALATFKFVEKVF